MLGRRRITTLLAASAVLVQGLLWAPDPALAAIPTCQTTNGHCYGIARYYQYDNLEAVGANLSVACLHVPDRYNQFVNMEMWLTTRADQPTQNWVEAGMTAGRLSASPGNEMGFLWYWADAYVATGGYFEHYIGQASVNTSTNVSFYWETNSAGGWGWGVYTGGIRRGWSGVGAYPGNVDLGGESTNGNTAVWGDAVDWQYRDKARNWHWITGSPIRAGNAIYSSVPATARVHVWTPSWTCGGSGPTAATAAPDTTAAADVRHLMQSPDGARRQLHTAAQRVATELGGEFRTGEFVKTTRGAALRRNGGTEVADNRPVYVVQTGGTFRKQSQHHGDVTGGALEVLVDAATGEVTDWGITASPQDLSGLGPLQALM